MKSYSQAGQDLFVNAVLEGKRDGIFLDVGCSHPIELSNTYALEKELGWTGILLDSHEPSIALCASHRTSSFRCADARTIDWGPVLAFPVHDYLSFDVDEAQVDALANLFRNPTRFRVLTVEHDQYRFGQERADRLKKMIKMQGYMIIADDVHSNGCCYEMWCVDPALVNMAAAEKFRSTGLDWKDVLKKGGVVA